MKDFNKSKLCLECGCYIDWDVYKYSSQTFGVPLCRRHQDWIRDLPYETTDETIALYFALRNRGVPAKLELDDGYKTIDIAIPDAKINIEVDGRHHNYNPRQAMSDLKRTYYSFLRGYFTLRIPNSLINNSLEETADFVTGILNENKRRTVKKSW